MLDQADAAQDDGAQDDLGDVGLGGQQAAELRPPHACHPADAPHARRDQALAVAEEVELAGELVDAVHVHGQRPAGRVLVDLDTALEDDEEIDAALAALEQHPAGRHRLDGRQARHARHLLVAELRKGLRLAGVGIARVERWIGGRRIQGHALFP